MAAVKGLWTESQAAAEIFSFQTQQPVHVFLLLTKLKKKIYSTETTAFDQK